MISREQIRKSLQVNGRQRLASDADFYNSVSLECEVNDNTMMNTTSDRHYSARSTLAFSRMISYNDNNLDFALNTMVDGLHNDLYGDVRNKVSRALYEVEVGGTRKGTVDVLTKLLKELS